MKRASEGPAPPRRPRSASPRSSSTRTPSDCSSTSSRRSSRSRRGRTRSATAGEGLLVVAPEDPVLQLLGDAPDPVDLPVLAVEVGPGLVRAEEDTVAADPGALDLGEEPARAEAHGPGRV